MLYRIKITCILGVKGQVVDLPENNQTRERLKKNIIEPAEQFKPVEEKKLKLKESK